MIEKALYDSIASGSKFQVKDGWGTYRAKKNSEDNVFVYAKGRSRYGYPYMADKFCEQYTLIPSSLPGVRWKKNVDKVVRILTKSGLWPNILQIFKNLQTMSYDDYVAISKIYRESQYIPGEPDSLRGSRLKVSFGEYITKYPFIMNGSSVNYDYLKGGIADANIKSMYFGGCNAVIKEQIKNALEKEERYSTRGYASYDVSFSYYPEKKKAFYSEEYKGTGNGHYYMALDANAALFCEDD